MSMARETLSPLIRSAQVRRLSLDLCQKLGNQLLSPSTSPNRGKASPTGSASPGSNGGDSANASPISNSFYERRGSAGLETIAQFAGLQNPDGVSHGIRPRRYSLIPLSTQKPIIHSPVSAIPSIKVFSAEKDDARQKNFGQRQPTQRRISYGCDLFANVGTIPSDESYKPPKAQNNKRSQECSFSSFSSSAEAQKIREISYLTSNDQVNLKTEEVLGRGSFGVVVKGIYQGKPVAVKIINTLDEAHKESLENEKNAKVLHHRNIAAVIEVIQVLPTTAIVVMELLHKGNLLRILNDANILIDSKKKIRIGGQIASALAFCHENGILHLDVKPQNILLDGNDNCKLSDFGTSKTLEDITSTISPRRLEGTVAYKAPELFRGSQPTPKCDVYSFGVCLWQILNREEPYSGLVEHSIIYQVVADQLRPDTCARTVDINNNENGFETDQCFTEFINIYKSCWQSEPSMRPDMQAIVEKLLLLLYSV